jgi:dihydrofolate synthase/folylpolyglutamate synthase
VIAEIAREHGSRLIQLGSGFDFTYQASKDGGEQKAEGGLIDFVSETSGQELRLERLTLGMRGLHQAANAAVALAAVAELRHQGWCISTEAIRRGLAGAVLPARVEYLPALAASSDLPVQPAVVLDTAHNQASARALVEALAELPPSRRRTLILAVSSDKDVEAILRELVPHFEQIIATQYLQNPRAVPADMLGERVREAWTQLSLSASPIVAVYGSPLAAWEAACDCASPDELVVITGSFFLVAELRPIVMPRASSETDC